MRKRSPNGIAATSLFFRQLANAFLLQMKGAPNSLTVGFAEHGHRSPLLIRGGKREKPCCHQLRHSNCLWPLILSIAQVRKALLPLALRLVRSCGRFKHLLCMSITPRQEAQEWAIHLREPNEFSLIHPNPIKLVPKRLQLSPNFGYTS
jgi:hypothetical protein